jgi:hypothetical protein
MQKSGFVSIRARSLQIGPNHLEEEAGLVVNGGPGIPSTNRPADSDSEIEFISGPSIAPQRRIEQQKAAPSYDDDSDIEFITHTPPPSTQIPSLSPTTPSPATFLGTEPISLSPEQKCVLDLVKSGRSVFYTGSAGRWIASHRLCALNPLRYREIRVATRDHWLASESAKKHSNYRIDWNCSC